MERIEGNLKIKQGEIKMKQTRNSYRKIMNFIDGEGGFDNFRGWSDPQKTEWVMSYFECSKNLARKVARDI